MATAKRNLLVLWRALAGLAAFACSSLHLATPAWARGLPEPRRLDAAAAPDAEPLAQALLRERAVSERAIAELRAPAEKKAWGDPHVNERPRPQAMNKTDRQPPQAMSKTDRPPPQAMTKSERQPPQAMSKTDRPPGATLPKSTR